MFNSNKEKINKNSVSRHHLPNFKLITNVDAKIMNELNNLVKNNDKKNDLFSAEYKISSNCELGNKVNHQYRQILLQKSKEDSNIEQSYTNWIPEINDTYFQKWIMKNFTNPYRTRIAFLYPNTSIDWHIDTDTSVSCRIQIPITIESSFFIKRRNHEDFINMKPNEVWFVNTGWPHKVENLTDRIRCNLIFGVSYENIRHFF